MSSSNQINQCLGGIFLQLTENKTEKVLIGKKDRIRETYY